MVIAVEKKTTEAQVMPVELSASQKALEGNVVFAAAEIDPVKEEQRRSEQDRENATILANYTKTAIRKSALAPVLKPLMEKTYSPSASTPQEQVSGLKEPLAQVALVTHTSEPSINDLGHYLPEELRPQQREIILQTVQNGIAVAEDIHNRPKNHGRLGNQAKLLGSAASALYSEPQTKPKEGEAALPSRNLLGTTEEITRTDIRDICPDVIEKTSNLIVCEFTSPTTLRMIEQMGLEQTKNGEELLRPFSEDFSLMGNLLYPSDSASLLLSAEAMRKNLEMHKEILGKQGKRIETEAAEEYLQYLDQLTAGLKERLGEPCMVINPQILSAYKNPSSEQAVESKLKIVDAVKPAAIRWQYDQTKREWNPTTSFEFLQEDFDQLVKDGLERLENQTKGHRLATGQLLIPAGQAQAALVDLCQTIGLQPPTEAFKPDQAVTAEEIFNQALALTDKRGVLKRYSGVAQPYWAAWASGLVGQSTYQLENLPSSHLFSLMGKNSLDKEVATENMSLADLPQAVEAAKAAGEEIKTGLPDKETLPPVPDARKIFSELRKIFPHFPATQLQNSVSSFISHYNLLKEGCPVPQLEAVQTMPAAKEVNLLTGGTGTGKTFTIQSLTGYFGENFWGKQGVKTHLIEANANNLKPEGIEGEHLSDSFVKIIQETMIEKRCTAEEAAAILEERGVIVVLDEAENVVASESSGKDTDFAGAVRTDLLKLMDPGTNSTFVFKMPPDETGQRKLLGINTRRIIPVLIASFSGKQYQDKLRGIRAGQGRNQEAVSGLPLTVENEDDLLAMGVQPDLAGRLSVNPFRSINKEMALLTLCNQGPKNPLFGLQNRLKVVAESKGLIINNLRFQNGALELMVDAANGPRGNVFASKGMRALFPIFDKLKKYYEWKVENLPINGDGEFVITSEDIRVAYQNGR